MEATFNRTQLMLQSNPRSEMAAWQIQRTKKRMIEEIIEGALEMNGGDKDKALHFLASVLVVSDQNEKLLNTIEEHKLVKLDY